MGRGRSLGLSLIAILLGRCAAAPPPSAPLSPQKAPRLIAPTAGRYLITRRGESVGEERFTITSSSGRWRARGEIDLAWPSSTKQGYALVIDELLLEPLAFEVWIEVAGERQTAKGECDGQFVSIHTENIMGITDSKTAYGRGTMLDFGSPIFNTLALSLLAPSFEEKRPVPVRTIVLAFPLLLPAVVLQEYVLVGRDGGLMKVAVGPVERRPEQRPTALWVRDDGLPVRVRTWPEGGGDAFEMILEQP